MYRAGLAACLVDFFSFSSLNFLFGVKPLESMIPQAMKGNYIHEYSETQGA